MVVLKLFLKIKIHTFAVHLYKFGKYIIQSKVYQTLIRSCVRGFCVLLALDLYLKGKKYFALRCEKIYQCCSWKDF